MRSHSYFRCFLLSALLLAGAVPALRADILYSVTELPTLGGFNNHGYSINNLGQIAGAADTSAGLPHAFLYSNGQMQDLGTLDGFSSYGYSLNNLGQVVGESGGHAFLYTDGQMQNLTTLSGGTAVTGYGINNLGQVTGQAATSAGTPHAFLYTNGQTQDLGSLSGGFNIGYGLNDLGQVTGEADTPSAIRAFLYTDGQMRDLGTLGGRFSKGFAVNNLGQVTGQADTSSLSSHAFLYSDGHMQDLNGLIGPALGITLDLAWDINNNGQIVADGTNAQGVGRVYLLTPVPEPGTWALCGVAGLGLLVGLRRRRS